MATLLLTFLGLHDKHSGLAIDTFGATPNPTRESVGHGAPSQTLLRFSKVQDPQAAPKSAGKHRWVRTVCTRLKDSTLPKRGRRVSKSWAPYLSLEEGR